MRPLYRLQQLLRTLRSRPDPHILSEAADLLSPGQLLLFRSMKPADQAHSLRVFRSLRRQGQSDPSLLAAALLHDVGKARHPLRPWERVVVVLAQALLPEWAERLGESKPAGWRRAFAVAKQHPRWGADMVAKVGGSPHLIELIRCHLDEPDSLQNSDIINQLIALQTADNQN